MTLNLHVARPATHSDEDRAAAARVDAVANQVWLGPMLAGAYPPTSSPRRPSITDWSFVRDGDLATIRQPLDVLGVNYYNPVVVAARTGGGAPISQDGHGESPYSPWPGCDDVAFLPQPGPHTAMGWPIDATGLEELLLRLHRDHPDIALMVTENGAAFHDEVDADGTVPDPDGSTTCETTSARCTGRFVPASTYAAISCGRCWTTSSGLRLLQAVRHRVRGLRDAAADPQGQRAMVRGRRRVGLRRCDRHRHAARGRVAARRAGRGSSLRSERCTHAGVRRTGLRGRHAAVDRKNLTGSCRRREWSAMASAPARAK